MTCQVAVASQWLRFGMSGPARQRAAWSASPVSSWCRRPSLYPCGPVRSTAALNPLALPGAQAGAVAPRHNGGRAGPGEGRGVWRPSKQPIRSAIGVPGQVVIDLQPRDLAHGPDVVLRRQRGRIVETADRDIDVRGVALTSEADRGSAAGAELTECVRRGGICLRCSGGDGQTLRREGRPGDQQCAAGALADPAVAIPAVDRPAADAVADCSAQAPAAQDRIAHPRIIAAVPRGRGHAGTAHRDGTRPSPGQGAVDPCTLAR